MCQAVLFLFLFYTANFVEFLLLLVLTIEYLETILTTDIFPFASPHTERQIAHNVELALGLGTFAHAPMEASNEIQMKRFRVRHKNVYYFFCFYHLSLLFVMSASNCFNDLFLYT